MPVENSGHIPVLERLFSESASDLTRYFTRRHGVGEWVKDLVQETFLQMARGIRDGKQFKCARGYLFGIARHLSQAEWTERGRNVVVPFEPGAPDIPAPIPDERIESARQTIATLSSIQREILDLRFSQGLSYAEIAEALEIPIGTVRSRLHHAVAEVKNRLERDGSLNPSDL